MHAAGQARIETPHSAHDVDPLEFVRTVFLEDRSVLHRILVRTRRAVNVPRIGIPGRRRIWMIVCNLPLANHYVMRQNAAHRFVESTADSFFRHLEFIPRFRVARM